MIKQVLTIIIITIFTIKLHVSFAQSYFIRNDTVPVKINNQSLKNPWVGGHNFCQFSDIDLNQDGIKDLFVFDRTGNKITTYKNHGSPGIADYIYAPELSEKFPVIKEWVLLRDYNCDGKEDVFMHTNGGIAVYRNDSDINGIKFTLVKNLILSKFHPSDTQSYNLYVSSVDIPAILDMDEDGDMDVLTFSSWGSHVELHLNNSQELYGHCDSLNYEAATLCWGKFSEGQNFDYTLNESCKRSEENVGNNGGIRHAGSALLAIDLNNNGTKDLILGDVGFSNMASLLNEDSSVNAKISEYDLNFPQGTIPVNLTLFPAAFYLDVDNDGIKDLLASPNAPNASENLNSIWFYKNQNKNDSASLQFVQDDFLQNSMIDVGEGAYPVLSDYNRDGKTDLLISNYGYYKSGGNHTSSVALFENSGNNTNPAFDLITFDFADLSGLELRNIYPSFGDLDSDGDLDMIIGEDNGELYYFENTASSGSAPSYILTAPVYSGIDVGQSATPQLIDINKDGKLDLLIGERNGSLNYIPNTGTVHAPVHDPGNMTEFFGGVDVRISPSITGYSVPFMYKENESLKLIVGSESGRLFYYSNIEQNLTGSFNMESDLYGGLNEGSRTAPAGFDMNNDGKLDLFVGNYAGGLSYFEDVITSVSNNPFENPVFKIYPVPASSYITVEFSSTTASNNALIVIYNYLGNIVYEQSLIISGRNRININELNNGIYFLSIRSENGQETRKFTVLKNN